MTPATKPRARLEHWFLLGGNTLYGAAYGSVRADGSRRPDGTAITTSRVLRLDTAEGIAETENTIYELGKKHPSYSPEERSIYQPCCAIERRNLNGSCDNCGAPCL
ncbi:hypothetical protein [Caldimonas sp. KR1-144]|uniref:hypothetical protein n=1 Tax=Caldimonas sp. KR1-144 TaxID=3400911 RepID=UPI003C0883FA